MTGRLSSEEREFATLAAQLRALEDDIKAARHAAQRAREMRGVDRDAPRESGPALRGERVTLAGPGDGSEAQHLSGAERLLAAVGEEPAERGGVESEQIDLHPVDRGASPRSAPLLQ